MKRLFALFVAITLLACSAIAEAPQTEEVELTPPDYLAMEMQPALDAIGEAANNDVCTFRSAQDEWDWISVHVDIVNYGSCNVTFAYVIEYTIDYAREAFPREDVHTILFRFYETETDSKGNTRSTTPIMLKIKEATFNKIDIDYIYTNSYTTQRLFMNSVDSAAVSVDYKQDAR